MARRREARETWKAVAAALAVLLGGVAIWWNLQATRTAPAVQAAASAPEPASVPEPASAPAAIAAVAGPASAASAPREDCRTASAKQAAAAEREGMRKLVDALAASASELDRALALAIRVKAKGPMSRRADPIGADQALRQLVELARGSGDSRVYALAYGACHVAPQAGSGEADACSLIDAWTWSQRDPGNAVAWMALAAEARVRGDEPSALEATAKAARADAVEHVSMQFLRLLGRFDVGQMSPLARSGVANTLIGYWAVSIDTFPLPACHGDPIDPAQSAVCDDLARLLATRGTTMADLSTALGLAKRLPWPEGEIDELSDLREAGLARLTSIHPPARQGACVWVPDTIQRWVEIGWFGEVAVARQSLEAVPPSAEELVRRAPAASAPASDVAE